MTAPPLTRRLLFIGLTTAVASIGALITPAQSPASLTEYCCYRVDVKVTGGATVNWIGNNTPREAGSWSSHYHWAARDLMTYRQNRLGGRRVLDRIETPGPTYGKTEFRAGERSNQSHFDSQGNETVDPPCRYEKRDPFHRQFVRSVSLDRLPKAGPDDWGLSLFTEGIFDYHGDCNNNSPAYTATESFHKKVRDHPPLVATWSMATADNLLFHPGRLKRRENLIHDFSLRAAGTDVSDPRQAHTYAATIEGSVKFTWFPRDRLQAELNALHALH